MKTPAPTFSPSRLNDFLECEHLAAIGLAVSRELAFRESFRVADLIAYYRRVRARFLAFVEHTPETYPLPVSHCAICDWKAVCEQR